MTLRTHKHRAIQCSAGALLPRRTYTICHAVPRSILGDDAAGLAEHVAIPSARGLRVAETVNGVPQWLA